MVFNVLFDVCELVCWKCMVLTQLPISDFNSQIIVVCAREVQCDTLTRCNECISFISSFVFGEACLSAWVDVLHRWIHGEVTTLCMFVKHTMSPFKVHFKLFKTCKSKQWILPPLSRSFGRLMGRCLF